MDGSTEIAIFGGTKNLFADGINQKYETHTHRQMVYPHILSNSICFRVSLFIFHLSPNFIVLLSATEMTFEVYLHEREQLQCILKQCADLDVSKLWIIPCYVHVY